MSIAVAAPVRPNRAALVAATLAGAGHRRRTHALHMWAFVVACAAVLVSGCASVSVSSISPTRYLAERRGDVLTTGVLSTSAQEVLRVVGIDAGVCQKRPADCLAELHAAAGLTDEQRLSALSETWLQAALAAQAAERAPPAEPDTVHTSADADADAALDAWIETARHAYAYLFFTARRPGERAFEDRQTQVRDYYNYAIQQTVTRLFGRFRGQPAASSSAAARVVGRWRITSDTEDLRLPQDVGLPKELVVASSLRFEGLRNTYRRDGLGAELVAVMDTPGAGVTGGTFAETRFPVVTALLRFEGRDLPEVLATRDVQVMMYDPYRSAQVRLAAETMPLAANFTAGYGLWLARSGFALQSLRTLFGLRDGLVRPQIHLMQPYDPERRIIVMLHGLASSPEAWVNLANEVLGDEELRRRYQIWQVYYPTNAPLPLNRHAISEALQQTLAHFDPAGTATASRDIVLVGHSMGGVLARLLVSASGQRLWTVLPAHEGPQTALAAEVRAGLAPYLEFEPLPQVSAAIFIAAPHRGTPIAEHRLARQIANLITLPQAMLGELGELAHKLAPSLPEAAAQAPVHIPNSIDHLSDRDPFVRAAAALPVAPGVRYHSIIGHDDPDVRLAASSDGIVPYTSAHLAGAASEQVVLSGHSVQEHPQAILEIRRILREQLRRPTAAAGTASR